MGDLSNWPLGNGAVICIACGAEVDRADAREYDKHGDRWQREDKQFEFMCKPCHGALCHQPRAGLEHTLVRAATSTRDRASFIERYLELEKAERA